ncbi:sodium:solute symporter [Streptomyces sp. NPDC056390]|uniref:sodium:solute symporter family protein n=1 Tax=Streptomyces sp. NPDC056390 TaxID=3345806 RepID=UPI0035E1DD9F
MSTVMVFIVLGFIAIACTGFVGRRKGGTDLAEWAVGGRRLGTAATWLLQAGESFTTFTFLGLVALSFSAGASSLYVLVYTPLAYLGAYFFAPRMWRKAAGRDYLTQADFFEDHYGSKFFGWLVAVLGVVFLLPYLQLQITGLGQIVQFAAGGGASVKWSMVIAFALVVAFVMWAGLRGVAAASSFKDAAMLVTLLILVIALPVHFAGGIDGVFQKVQARMPEALYVHGGGEHDTTWFLSSVAMSVIGIMFLTAPQNWTPVLSARSPKVLRRNNMILPLYSLCLVMPVVLGFVAMTVLKPGNNGNAALFTLAAQALPGWVVGLIAVGGVAAAMVPSAGILVALCPLVARNVLRVRSERGQYWASQLTVLALAGLALLLALLRPDSLANLLLLTFSGLGQLAPATAAALVGRRGLLGTAGALSGVIAGEAVVVWLTFGATVDVGHISVGLVGLAVNIAVALAVEAASRALGRGGVRRPSTSTPAARNELAVKTEGM